jgi:hypothetical protein
MLDDDKWTLLWIALLQIACCCAWRSQVTKTQDMRSMKSLLASLTNYHGQRAAELSPAAMPLGTVPSCRIPTKFSAVILTRNQRKGTISLRI